MPDPTPAPGLPRVGDEVAALIDLGDGVDVECRGVVALRSWIHDLALALHDEGEDDVGRVLKKAAAALRRLKRRGSSRNLAAEADARAMAAAGATVRSIAEDYDVATRTVYRWLRRGV